MIALDFNFIYPMSLILGTLVYLLVSRAKFEEDILKEYNDKFEQWKAQYQKSEQKTIIKKPVGLAYEIEKNGKKEIEIEFFTTNE